MEKKQTRISHSNMGMFGEYVDTYSLSNAVDDGLFIPMNITKSQKVGLKFPVYVSQGAWHECTGLTDKDGQKLLKQLESSKANIPHNVFLARISSLHDQIYIEDIAEQNLLLQLFEVIINSHSNSSCLSNVVVMDGNVSVILGPGDPDNFTQKINPVIKVIASKEN